MKPSHPYPRLPAIVLLTCLATCALAGCGNGKSGSRVFPDSPSAVSELGDIRFGESCERIHQIVRPRLPESQAEKSRPKGSNFWFNVSYPLLGSSSAHFFCNDDDALERVMIRLDAHLRDYTPYERSLARLRDLWGEPAQERTRKEQGPNAERLRNLGGNPQTYELHSATWRHGQNTEATLAMEFGFREIELRLHFRSKP